MAMELGRNGITVNCLAPSLINTDIIKTVPEELKAKMVSAVPVRRIGEPEEVASMVAFLAGEEAGYVSGQCIKITGGWW
jgi:3-oxoacyl-[acyl-carrier protein] reductase